MPRPYQQRNVNRAKDQPVKDLFDQIKPGSNSIIDLCEKSGLSYNAVIGWRSGETRPRIEQFAKLAEAAGFELKLVRR